MIAMSTVMLSSCMLDSVSISVLAKHDALTLLHDLLDVGHHASLNNLDTSDYRVWLTDFIVGLQLNISHLRHLPARMTATPSIHIWQLAEAPASHFRIHQPVSIGESPQASCMHMCRMLPIMAIKRLPSAARTGSPFPSLTCSSSRCLKIKEPLSLTVLIKSNRLTTILLHHQVGHLWCRSWSCKVWQGSSQMFCFSCSL